MLSSFKRNNDLIFVIFKQMVNLSLSLSSLWPSGNRMKMDETNSMEMSGFSISHKLGRIKNYQYFGQSTQ